MKSLTPYCAAACVLISLQVYSQPYMFAPVAGLPGTGTTLEGNNDGTNTTARFGAPAGISLDRPGNLYVADPNAIRRVASVGTNWVVTTLAGVLSNHGGTDGTNDQALFDNPQGVTVDANGNIYVADTFNNAIRKVTPFGTNWAVTTIAGGDRLDPGAVDETNRAARFNNPYGIAVDGNGTLYVADTGNSTIRKVAPIGTNWVVTTLAGLALSPGSVNASNSFARFRAPVGVAVDTSGALYVADLTDNTIRKLIAYGTNWAVSTLAGTTLATGSTDGLGGAARFNLPEGIAVDWAGYVYVTDSGNNTIRRITPAGLVSTIGGLAGATGTTNALGVSARFNQPYGVAVDGAGRLFLADTANYTIRQGTNATILTLSRSGSFPVLSWPVGLTGFVPQVCTTLPAGAWSSVHSNGVTVSGNTLFLTSSIPTVPSFFRLAKPIP